MAEALAAAVSFSCSLLLSGPSRLLTLIALVACLGVVHEFCHVRKSRLLSRYPRAIGLAAIALVYALALAAFLAVSTLSLRQQHLALSQPITGSDPHAAATHFEAITLLLKQPVQGPGVLSSEDHGAAAAAATHAVSGQGGVSESGVVAWGNAEEEEEEETLLQRVFPTRFLSLDLSAVPPAVEASLLGDVAATLVVFLFSVVLENTSAYDAFWSVLPPAIAAFWWAMSPDQAGSGEDLGPAAEARNLRRLLDMTVYLLWAFRLTFNWARSWRGLHHADWRYLKGGPGTVQPFDQKTSPVSHWAMSLAAFHMYPTIQVFVAMLPTAVVMYYDQGTSAPQTDSLNIFDFAGFAMGVAAVAIQHVADNQLYAFRSRKNKKKEDVLCSGLWSISRHPNYLGENMHWAAHYLFAVGSAANGLSLYYLLCPLSILVLFSLASIPILEQRMLARRPEYQRVIDTVPALIPFTKF